MTLEDIINYLKTPRKLEFDDNILLELSSIKKDAVNAKDESLANKCWILENIYLIQKKYVDSFALLSSKKYEAAWRMYEEIEIALSHLSRNFNYLDNQYELKFIEIQTSLFQKLFPYVHFTSREMSVGKEKCTICGKIITSPRNSCNHIVGNLYMGEMCCREVMDIQLHGISITTEPKDKYTVLHPMGLEYNYEAIEMLLEHITSPYMLWNIREIKKLKKEFRDIGRNERCPCGSGKKYKHCCRGTEKEIMLHKHIEICDGKPFPSIPVKEIGTWKEKVSKDD